MAAFCIYILALLSTTVPPTKTLDITCPTSAPTLSPTPAPTQLPDDCAAFDALVERNKPCHCIGNSASCLSVRQSGRYECDWDAGRACVSKPVLSFGVFTQRAYQGFARLRLTAFWGLDRFQCNATANNASQYVSCAERSAVPRVLAYTRATSHAHTHTEARGRTVPGTSFRRRAAR